MPTTKKQKVIVWKKVTQAKTESKSEQKVESSNFFDQIANRFKNFDRQNNIHMIVWIVLLLIWLYLLRSWIVWLIFLILGILFVTGYFEKK